MDAPALTDPTTSPSEEIIAGILAKGYGRWEKFFAGLREEHPDLATEWRYYNDGKSWLMKVTRKKKTVVWMSVHAGYFRITAYLTEKAGAAVKASALSDDCKEQFAKSKRFGKLIGVTVFCKNQADVKSGLALVDLKVSLL